MSKDGELEIKISGDAKDVEKTLNDLVKTAKKDGDEVEKNVKVNCESISKVAKASAAVVAAGLAAVAGATTYAISVGKEYETSLAKVSTIADTTKKSLEDISDEVITLSNNTGKAASDINEAVYEAISSGIDTANAVDFVASSTKLAVAGFTDTANSVDLLTTIINSYGKSADDVTQISDILMQVQNKGKTTINELSGAMGKVIPTANAYGVNLENLGASYALMTSKGIATAESTTYLNSMLNELGKSGTTASDILKSETGKTFKELMDSGMSLGEVLQILQHKADSSGLSMGDMFGSAEAGKAAMTLAAGGVDEFNTSLQNMQNSAGLTEDAFNKMEDTTDTQLEKLKNNLQNTAIAFYNQFKEPLKEGLKETNDSFSSLQNEMSSGKLGSAIKDLGGEIGKVLSSTVKFAKDALPKVIKFLTSLVKILPTLTKAVIIGGSAWAGYKLAMKIEKSQIIGKITAMTAAVVKEYGTVNIATISQYAWNTALSANPLGIFLTVLGGAIAAIALLSSNLSAQDEELDIYGNKVSDAKTRIEEYTQSYNDSIQAIEDNMDSELSHIDTVENLKNQLSGIVDENGKIQSGYENRVDFILGELNESLGTEYTRNGEIIQSYKDMQAEIDNLIEKKRAQIILSSYEDEYKTAIENQKDATEQWNAASNTRNTKQAEYNALSSEQEQLLDNIAAAQERLSEADYGTVEYAEAEKAIEDAQNALNEWSGNNTTALNTAKKEYEAADIALTKATTNLENNYADRKQYEEAYANFTSGNYGAIIQTTEVSEQRRQEIASQSREEIENALWANTQEYDRLKTQYNNTSSAAEREAIEARMTEITNDSAALIQQYQTLGGQMVNGMTTGLYNNQSALTDAMHEVVQAALDEANKTADVHSPSKKTRWTADMMGAGMVEGTKESTKYIVDAEKKQMNAVLDEYNKAWKSDRIEQAFSQAKTSVTNGMISNAPQPQNFNNNSVVKNTYNTTYTERAPINLNTAVTLDGEKVYENQQIISARHGDKNSKGW